METGEEHEDQQIPPELQDCTHERLLTPSPSPDSCHDSCYDSDNSPSSSRRGSGLLSHEDVSRQSSDTLAAERDDSSSEDKATISQAEQAEATLLEPDVTTYPDYNSKVEFAIKLGYKENHLQRVLQLFGPEIKQNELLNELIKIQSDDVPTTDDELANEEDMPLSESVPEKSASLDSLDSSANLRPIVIDGSNVALSHGNKKVFSCRGIQIVVEWFRQRGHTDIKVIIPSWRKEASRPDAPINDQEILLQLEREDIVVFTPSRRVGGRRVVCYDDRYIVKHAAEVGGVIVSNDTFRDLMQEDPAYKTVVEERLLLYSFINDSFMPPEDPLGRKGPSLDNFLRKEPLMPEALPPPCPYGKKCTYGNKCKFYHPERGLQPHKSVTEKLAEQARLEFQKVKEKQALRAGEIPKIKVTATESAPLPSSRKQALGRTKSVTPGKTPLSRTKSLAPSASLPESGFRGQSPGRDSKPKLAGFDDQSDPSGFGNLAKPNLHLKQTDTSKPRGKMPLSRTPSVVSTQDSTISNAGQEQLPNVHFDEVNSDKLRYPMQWLAPETGSLGHEKLRPTVSEPVNRKPSQEPCRIGGHLALAKKLSDEGRQEDSIQKMQSKEPNLHQKLQRQLSLKGSEDPRWLARGANNKSQPNGKPQPKYYFGSDNPLAKPSQDINQNYPTQNIIINPHENIHLPRYPKKEPLSKHASDRFLSPYSDLAVHTSVQRLNSAPPRTDVREQVQPPGGPRMERQNSTSDPQLYIPNRESVDVPVFPETAFYREPTAQIPVTYMHPFVINPMQPPVSMPPPYMQCQWPAIRLPASTSDQSLRIQAAQGVHPEMVNRSCASHYPGQSTFNTSAQFTVAPERKPQAHSNPSIFPPAEQNMQSALYSFGPESKDGIKENQQLRQVGGEQKDMHLGLIDNRDAIRWGSNPKVDDGWPEPVQQAANGTEDPSYAPTGEREKLFYHLRALFPEDKVKIVMAEHPEETDPGVLCKHIIAML